MRRVIALTVVLLVALPAAVEAAQTISASPKTVNRGDVQTVTGRGWPVIEFCSRTIRVSVRSAQNIVPIAQRHIRANGRFSFRWIPRNRNVGRGSWRLVARMRCESGKDGSTIFTRATFNISVR
jgi:hypothetical protein